MKAEEIYFLKFLEQKQQLKIPIYQRKYSWNLKECEKLLDDIVTTGSDNENDNHFLGSIVCIGEFSPGLTRLSLIDGQQRLTSILLLITALSQYLKKHSNDNIDHDKLISYYLINEKEKGEDNYKLILTQDDKNTLNKIIDNVNTENEDLLKNYSSKDSRRMVDNYKFFQEKINEENNADYIYNGLSKLIIVYIGLESGKDNPQLIFESLNSTGLELNQADLIRNYILMDLEPSKQKNLYNNYWHEMEIGFGHSEKSELFDRFIRDYLTIKLDRIPTLKNIYDEFKIYSKNFNDNIELLISDIFKYSLYLFKIAFDKEEDEDIRKAFNSLNSLKVDVVRPFILEVYKDYADSKSETKISKNELIEIVKIVENYLFRRTICNIPTPSLNKTFAKLYKEIDKKNHLESLKVVLISKKSNARFPDDNEFKTNFLIRDMYNFRNRNYILSKFENYQNKEHVIIESYTIEHIMPQNPNLSQDWKNNLGDDWENIHKKYLHTIGNLTLTAYNSELSDRPFIEKRDMKGGFKSSPLYLNEYLRKFDTWNENLILKRAEKLFIKANEIWNYPKVNSELIKEYELKKQDKKWNKYSINDYSYLNEDKPMRHLFDELRKRILNIDADVIEEYKKQYIAYKTSTNFVDIIPQQNALKLSLVIPFDELEDSQEKVRDVSKYGRWGNGLVEIKIDSMYDLDYALNLIKQAFDYQYGK